MGMPMIAGLENETIGIGDADPERARALAEELAAAGFPRERIRHAADAESVRRAIEEDAAAIWFFDESLGSGCFREAHAALARRFGSLGFFLFAVTEGAGSDFVSFAAAARVDGVIFRPYRADEFRRRAAEVFAVKWPNRVVAPNDEPVDLFLVKGASDPALFERAREKSSRLGARDPLTPDPQATALFGAEGFAHPAIRPGRAAFEKVRLSFKAVARNGVPLGKPFPLHALEVDARQAVFECASADPETGDHLSIEAEIVEGEEAHQLRIEGRIVGGAGEGLITVEFDAGNRSRLEAAMRIVAQRFRHLKEFFKHAKGA